MNNKELNMAADNMRILSVAMVEKAKSGHPGGAMGGADFVNVLFSEFLKFDPDNMYWPFRDRFFLDPGHMSPMLYSILALTGNFTLEELMSFRQWGSPTPGHPELNVSKGIENTSGPLGQGHAMALGAAITERFFAARFGEWLSHKTYAFISDGGIQEEISQGVGRIAGVLGLNNFILFYDSNDIQLSTSTEVVSNENTALKYESWGWRVINIDGNDSGQIRDSLIQAIEEKEKPVIIIGKTIMGKGLIDAYGKSFEKQLSTHGQPVSKAGADLENTIRGLGGDPDNPFRIFPEVEKFYADVLDKKRIFIKEQKKVETEWAEKNPELATKLYDFLDNKNSDIDFLSIAQKENIPSRSASAAILTHLAEKVDNMIVMSADLSNSDKTDGYLKRTKYITKNDFTGKFLHAGVSELTMAAIAAGMALHGGVIPVCGTFFVFSEYMKPAVRMAALMELKVIYIWTHDAFRVGEDGPTHQPVEQEAQIRLMEFLKNHSGRPSMLILRPADAIETNVAWKMAYENNDTPTGLILSRQNIKDIPALPGSDRSTDALGAEKGAYIVKKTSEKPDIILVGSGSEVSTLLDAATKLKEEKQIMAQVVSAVSETLFRKQNSGYQNDVMPVNVPVLGLTAGLPQTISSLVGPYGKAIGLDHFGYSAPAGVLDEKFGFTGDNIYLEALKFLKNACC
ncbi:transketolase family protein [Bacteroidota bacterium]